MPETPREIKVSYSKKSALWMTAGIVLFLCLCNFFKIQFFQSLENKTIDFRFGIRGSRLPEAPIRILAIDEKSLREVGQWPWPRAIHAQLIRQLKQLGVKCVFYDVFFPEPERTQEKMLNQLETVLNSAIQGDSKTATKIRSSVLSDIREFQATQNGDKVFSQAIQDTGNVFLPIEPITNGKEGRTPNAESLHLTDAQLFGGFTDSFINAQSLIISIPDLQEHVADSGHTRYFPDPDGIYRYYPTVMTYSGVLIPNLSLQVARVFQGIKDPVKVYEGDHVEVGESKIPILDLGFALINFCGPRGTFTTISASDVLNGRVSPETLKGSIVLIGATADGLYDLRPTPFTRASPGVEINANIIENVLDKHFLTLAPDYLKYILVLFLALIIWYLVPRVTPTQGSIWFGALLVLYTVLACETFSYGGLLINMTYPVLALMLTFLTLTTYKFRTEVRHSRYMKQMFQSMVTPKVVEEILKMPAGIELGGEEKELTVMFSDIRGFTTYSEKHTPHEVVGILNEYLTQMTNMIFQTEGTLDKYIGDAIMAFWGAPTGQPDHAYRACSTALGMVDLLHATLHPKWESEGKEKLHIGIGLNTGPIVVGFVGSQAIKNYTLIGDAVNLGSRLEGTTKEYKVEIIIGEQTYEHVKMDMLCRELDLIRVKGKMQPIRIYELIDHRLKAAGAKELKVNTFQEGLAYYRLQRWDDAIKRFRVCLELDPEDGPAKIFIDRCEHLKHDSLPADWDGVFVMKTK
jgi:adenylate cyclase